MTRRPRHHLDTRAVHNGGARDDFRGAAVTPIVRSTVFEQPPGADYHDILYPRLSTLPNQVLLGRAVADLEGGEAGLVTASGMAAISTTLLTALAKGGHLLAHRSLYGGTHSLIEEDLAGLGIAVDFIDATTVDGWDTLVRDDTRAIYVEALTNPRVEVADHRAVVAFARRHGLWSIIDNTFATPVVFRPLGLGYDVVVHSATKYLNGHSDVVAGAIVGTAERVSAIKRRLDHFGGCLDPGAAYLFQRGLKTIGLRVPRQNDTALTLAHHLAAHPAVAHVCYPGLPEDPGHVRARELFGGRFGAMLAFECAGGAEAAARLATEVKVAIHSPSLGGVESLITRPAATSHAGMPADQRAALGISDGLIRVSVGIEHVDDLIADFDQALAAAHA